MVKLGYFTYNCLLKKKSSTPKTPNLPYWVLKSAKKRMKNNCWTKTGNLEQCAMAHIEITIIQKILNYDTLS